MLFTPFVVVVFMVLFFKRLLMVIDIADSDTASCVNQLMPGDYNKSYTLKKHVTFTCMFLFEHLWHFFPNRH